MRPIINLAELKFQDDGPNSPGKHALVSSQIGARKLGYNITICPPGKSVCPFHSHHIQEELFFILEGAGLLRFGSKEYPLRKHDFIACPPGGAEVAHQIINTGTSDLIYLALSSHSLEEICEYPDSDKVGVFVGEWGALKLRKMFRGKNSVDYLDGETNPQLRK